MDHSTQVQLKHRQIMDAINYTPQQRALARQSGLPTHGQDRWVIVHFIRHAKVFQPLIPLSIASTNYIGKSSSYHLDPGLAGVGEYQCDILARNFEPHAKHVTHILSSPMRRCVETARRGLGASTRKGLLIKIMPALAGREGVQEWDMVENQGDSEVDGSWVMDRLGPRDQLMTDAQYVMRCLKLQGLDAREARKVKEVVIVTQGLLLGSLLGHSKYNNILVMFM